MNYEVICQSCGGIGENELWLGDAFEGSVELRSCHACGGLGLVEGYDPFLGKPNVSAFPRMGKARRQVPAAIEMALKAIKEVERARNDRSRQSNKASRTQDQRERNRVYKARG